MKAVIVIDVDDDLDLSQIHANVELNSNELENTFHKGYLLKQVRPLPDSKKVITSGKVKVVNYLYANGFADGFNACLNEITGETE